MSENNFESAMCNGAHKEKCDTIFSHLYLFIMKGSVFEHVLSFQVIYMLQQLVVYPWRLRLLKCGPRKLMALIKIILLHHDETWWIKSVLTIWISYNGSVYRNLGWCYQLPMCICVSVHAVHLHCLSSALILRRSLHLLIDLSRSRLNYKVLMSRWSE